MRTVEQIKKELEAARNEEAQAAKKTAKLEQEMKEIYLAAKQTLGIVDIPSRN
jgi:hypothetical protein